ncbi:hypothetical protein SAMN05444285_102229 [Draconibacterium orientale]|uniref:Uncharacterized protein n=1 Tax=Draconibacterium orientale TaxID=1168034 RepID=X5E5C5_9BACT|nr:DUF6261 family protein [Draconibacterium orientale]AHW61786.1 hypothetical protein FH5T_08285 [Draconibacterium orientale]SES83748.1 hypothetical protein SAMN05444285_102229 [Draconibacterium orientale]
MNFIVNIPLTRLRHNDYFQYMTDVKGLVTQATPAALNVEEEAVAFDNSFTALDEAINVDKGSVFTEKIQDADHRRDNTWSALNGRVKATLYSPIPEEVEAAKHLERVFNLYGNIRNLSLKEQTAAATNLNNDLKKPKMAVHCQTIGITPWVLAHEAENTAVNDLQNQRDSEKANRNYTKAKEVRVAFDEEYNALVNRINAMVTLRMATPVIENFIIEVNQKIKNLENQLAVRQGHRDSGEEEPSDSPVDE